jgi:hypothetical protein
MPPPAAIQADARLWTARVTRSSFSWLAGFSDSPGDRRSSYEGVYGNDKNGHNSVTIQNRTHVYMNFFDHKDLGNHLPQLCPKVVKHPVYSRLMTYQSERKLVVSRWPGVLLKWQGEVYMKIFHLAGDNKQNFVKMKQCNSIVVYTRMESCILFSGCGFGHVA